MYSLARLTARKSSDIIRQNEFIGNVLRRWADTTYLIQVSESPLPVPKSSPSVRQSWLRKMLSKALIQHDFSLIGIYAAKLDLREEQISLQLQAPYLDNHLGSLIRYLHDY